MIIQKIMTAPAIAVTLDDSVNTVKSLFASHKIHHMLVVNEARLVGVLCEAELMRAVSPYIDSHVFSTRDLATLRQRVHQVVKRNPKRLLASDPVLHAFKLFNIDSVCCIPVVDDDNKPVGIVTRGNLISFIQGAFAAELGSE